MALFEITRGEYTWYAGIKLTNTYHPTPFTVYYLVGLLKNSNIRVIILYFCLQTCISRHTTNALRQLDSHQNIEILK